MNRNFKTLILSSSLIVASISVQAGMNQNITYQKPDPTKFTFFYLSSNWDQCAPPNDYNHGGGAIQGYGTSQQSQFFAIGPEDWSPPQNTISFSGSPSSPQPIQWKVDPYNKCISYASGINGLLNDTVPGIISGITKNTVTSQYAASGQPVYTVTTNGNLSNFLPPNMTYKDNTTGNVTQLKFAGCSDYQYNNYKTGSNDGNINLLNCCYTTDGSSADCQVNK